MYYDGIEWRVASRSMAYAEGTIPIGLSFKTKFSEAIMKTQVLKVLEDNPSLNRQFTWIFELTSPETRVVTPYKDTAITLIGARNNVTGVELGGQVLDDFSKIMNVRRPRSYTFTTLNEAIAFVKTLNSMEEGFVMTYESLDGFWRLKCKNEKYLAIAHMRENGTLTPRHVMELVLHNDYQEYLSYFPEDQKYFDLVIDVYTKSLTKIKQFVNDFMNIESQKEFALKIVPLCTKLETGVLFSIRKTKQTPEHILCDMGGKKVAEHLGLKDLFSEQFGINFDDTEM
jgi:hypothetical protein